MLYAGRFPYQKLVKYPHLTPEEAGIWERFIDKYPNAYKTCLYDFAMGRVDAHAQKAQELGIAGAERVNQYRCDVVAFGDNEIHLIELKQRATPDAIGELSRDYHMFMRDERPQLKVETYLVAGEAAPEMDFLCAKEDIYLILV